MVKLELAIQVNKFDMHHERKRRSNPQLMGMVQNSFRGK